MNILVKPKRFKRYQLVIAFLLLGSIVIACIRIAPEEQFIVRESQNIPDFEISGLESKQFDDEGNLSYRLTSDYLYHYELRSESVLRQPRFWMLSESSTNRQALSAKKRESSSARRQLPTEVYIRADLGLVEQSKGLITLSQAVELKGFDKNCSNGLSAAEEALENQLSAPAYKMTSDRVEINPVEKSVFAPETVLIEQYDRKGIAFSRLNSTGLSANWRSAYLKLHQNVVGRYDPLTSTN